MSETLQTKDGGIQEISRVEFISTSRDKRAYPIALKPKEGHCFEVNPEGINQELFKVKRNDPKQEKVRQCILEVFEELKKSPERNRPFKTLIPNKTWNGSKTVWSLKKLSRELGTCISDWVEQTLEWAQRIANGETWEAVCNEPDTAIWFRLVVWKDGDVHFVGGSYCLEPKTPPADVKLGKYYDYNGVEYAVPSVTIYD